MNRHQPASVRPWHQTNWDWRAALNFIGGGTGTGLLIAATIAGGAAYAGLALGALACVAFGLAWVWMEIGRPWRAINVIFHPQTSWMTRESLVAAPLFVVALAAAWTGAIWLIVAAAAVAALYLYCQGRILKASKGIPAWREPTIVPLVIATGLAEGVGLAIVALAVTGNFTTRWLIAVLVVLLIVRDLMWRQYRRALAGSGAPKGALEVLARIDLPFSLAGNWGPVVLLLVAVPEYGLANALASLAGMAAAGAGWFLKYTIVARAAFNQGYALPALPIRGAGTRVPGTKPGWEKPAQG